VSVAVYKPPPSPAHDSVVSRFLSYQELASFTYETYFTDKIVASHTSISSLYRHKIV
jgi:hypothetical protein